MSLNDDFPHHPMSQAPYSDEPAPAEDGEAEAPAPPPVAPELDGAPL
ncbi:hypothetical protein SAMN06264364_14921 [Quadrisphaera granulorum]|uniref:Uncharacterized protein n=1 Tax=Quadrisphaera granulorum TaxID=317664 RepID=A0A315ZKZ2_9ACTN|nr:hypothetical protein [Quadrisphaera granulorum]PWJ46285.1 hypothetical protein BXY45_14921 [Quadrisphaera granulorum]SZE99100.1 hypothetical protein SAMN06264364_14921 [Quadrisphaera granulorum]